MPSLPEAGLAGGVTGLTADHDAALLLGHLQVSVADVAGHILYVNDRFCEASGYRREELIGQPYSLLASGRHPPGFFREMWATLVGGFPWHGELCNRRQDGSEFWVELTAVPLPATAELPVRFVAIGSDITRVVEAEQQSRRSETRFRGLAETISAAVILHRGGNLLYANRALERISGYSHDELMQMSFIDLVHPDLRAGLLTRGEARLRGEQDLPDTYETRILTKSGKLRWLEISASRIDYEDAPATLGTAIDITERKRAEAAQRHIQQVLQQIIDGDPVPTFVIDANHVVTHWNSACAIVTGVPAIKMVGSRRAWTAFYDEERPVLADLIVDGAIDGRIDAYYHGRFRPAKVIPGAYEAEDFFPGFGNHGRWLFFTAAPLRDVRGKVIGAIETLVDVTERKHAESSLQRAYDELETVVERRTAQLAQAKATLEEDVHRREASEAELRKRNIELTQVNARLQETQEQLLQSEKMASIGQLAAGVAHEINNPIGFVQSNLGTLERYLRELGAVVAALDAAAAQLPPEHPAARAVADAKQKSDFDFLQEDLPNLVHQSRDGVDRVRKIVADLKDFSRIDSGQDWLFADLHQGIESTLNIVSSEIRYRAEVQREFGQLPQIECLPSQLNQVFLNLLVNAAQAIPDGQQGRVTIRTGHDAGDGGSDHGGHVWVEVEDNGSGIPAEQLKLVFDPFFTTKPVGKGTGLGLSLSYGIVHKHGGRIEVRSEQGTGSRFRVVLPVRQATTVR